MRVTAVLALLAGALGPALGPALGQATEVSRTVTVDATPAEVWQFVGPFCSISDWYPGLDSCTEEQVDGATARRLVATDGAQFLEKQLGHDDAAMSYGYAILEGPLPVKDYSATLSVADSDGKAALTWQSSFEPDGVSGDEAAGIVSGIYDAGLEAVRAHFAE